MIQGICDDSGKVIARFVSNMTLKDESIHVISDTLSLRRKATRKTPQRWVIESSVEPLREGAQSLMVNLVTKGYSGTVKVAVPQNYGAYLKNSANLDYSGVCSVSGTKSSSQVYLSSVRTPISAGTFVNFSGHTKVYMVTADFSGNSGALNIYPNLMKDVNGSMVWKDGSVFMQAMYDMSTISGMTYSDGILMDIGTVKLVEVI